MGEAIARFRDMALAIRRVCDERHSQPRGRAVKPAAAKKFAKQCREHFLQHEKAGMNYPARYVHGLCKLRDEAERHPDPPPPGEFDLPLYIEWLPEPFANKEPGYSTVRNAIREAVKEAVRWGSLFTVAESRIKALDAAADMLAQYAGSERYVNPPEEDVEVHPYSGATTYLKPSQGEADADYIARHREFAEALDSLAPFIEEPPTAAATAEKQTSTAKQKKRRDRKGVGGRPERYSLKFIREVVNARERDQKQAAKGAGRLYPFPRWLSDYCTGKGIDIREKFPPKTPGEVWSDTANRFWKAAKKRLREAETNRH
jgi:hypothetical protein